MGKNKNKNKINQGEQQNEHENQNDDGNSSTTDGGENKDGGVLSVVLKVDLHCEGCETKIKKCLRSVKGVEWVKGSDDGSNKLTVIGNVDPVNLREMLEKKIKKRVELVSPQPKKDKGKDKDKDGGDNKQEKKSEKDKLKEIPVTTAVMKLNLHCQGCIEKLRKAVAKTKGFHDMSVDEEKNLITVKGAIDMKALAEALKVKLKKPVEIVPPKKDKDKDKDKNKDGGGSEKKEKGGGGEKGDQNMVQYAQYGYPNPEYANGYGWVYPEAQFHAPQMFSDENPNACSIM